MTATSTTLTTPDRAVSGRTDTTKRIWRTAALAGVAAAVATTAVAGIAHSVGVSLDIGGEAIPLPAFAQLTLVGTLVGAILAVVFSHRASRPRHTFVVTTVVLTALSVVPDIAADAATGTRLLLALTHLVAAAIVVPALASRLSD